MQLLLVFITKVMDEMDSSTFEIYSNLRPKERAKIQDVATNSHVLIENNDYTECVFYKESLRKNKLKPTFF